MQRVAVIGSGGAGKTTFANALGLATGLPVVHLDELHWRPGWVEPPDDEWYAQQLDVVARERWIADGNYVNTQELRFARADTVLVLEFSRWHCVLGVLKRVTRNWHRAVQAPGCREHFDWAFLRWIWRFPKDSMPLVEANLAQHLDHLHVVRLRSPGDVARYLRDVTGRL